MSRKSKIPILDCVITAHKYPDGDALSSMRAVYDYIINGGKRAALKLNGTIPDNLLWIIEGVEIIDKGIPEWTKMVIVLDSAPTSDRIGWEIPKRLPIFNIDHHINRIDEHKPSKKIFVIDAFATAEILFRRFGIKNDILVVGSYTDTYFAKNIKQVFKFILDLEVPEEKIEEYLNKISFRSDKRAWKIIRDGKVHKCKNGFIIVETHESDPTAIETAMKILLELNERICLIFGEYQVKLRTTDKNLDLSLIAKEFGGGGHKFASGIPTIKERVSEFKDYIIHYKG